MGNIEWIIDSRYNQTWHTCLLGYPISSNLSDWILTTTAFDNEAGHQLTEAYHNQHPQNPGSKMSVKDWERQADALQFLANVQVERS